MEKTIVNGVWVGNGPLTNIEKLCIESYLDNGHEFHLYTYGVDNVPARAKEVSLAEIVDYRCAEMFVCPTHFADYIRAIVIHRVGGWYVDLDTWCIKPIDFPEPYVFVSESSRVVDRDTKDAPIPPDETYDPQQHFINNNIFKAPSQSEFLKRIIRQIDRMDTLTLTVPKDWLVTGVLPFREAVPYFEFERFVKPPAVFDGVRPDELLHIVSPGVRWNFSPNTRTIHVRASAWKRYGLDPDGTYPHDSLFEILKRTHNVG